MRSGGLHGFFTEWCIEWWVYCCLQEVAEAATTEWGKAALSESWSNVSPEGLPSEDSPGASLESDYAVPDSGDIWRC